MAEISFAEALGLVSKSDTVFWNWTSAERVAFIRDVYEPLIEPHFRSDYFIDSVDFERSTLMQRKDWIVDYRDHLPRDWTFRSYLVKLRASFVCCACDEDGNGVPRPAGEMQAHHRVSPYEWRQNAEGRIFLDTFGMPMTPHGLENLECLCESHHEAEHPEKF